MDDRSTVHVRAPSRLHFGLFSFGNRGRQFGGVGAMLARPALHLTIRPSDRFTVAGPSTHEITASVRRCCEMWQVDTAPACHIELVSAPRRHVGLGSGTQLACAVAAGLAAWLRQPALGPLPTPAELAQWTGRGQRSAVGTYGFLMGGLIVEAGRLPEEALSPLECRLEIPAAWRFVLVESPERRGFSGVDEQQAFAALPAVSDALREELIAEVQRRTLPAIAAQDCAAFGESLHRYGRLAGMCFAPVQGGPYNGPQTEQLVEEIRALGVSGVGQSSWGPTVYCVVENQDAAEHLAGELPPRCSVAPLAIQITPADNHGAVLTRTKDLELRT
ncbi:MAG: GHMP family kinase ATP-binding protein [Pirellulaceae bacterium]